jgi:aspartyl-tRNA(Asn)/glutamyl-tRNA(Gln) amidotransferase subunit B
VRLLDLVEAGTISHSAGREVLAAMATSGRDADELVAEMGLAQISDTATLEATISAVLAANPRPVADYRAGKEGLLGWFVGQVMQATGGKANPQLASQMLREQLRRGA